jgi:LytS/YehU family sensor histidine kinase
MSLAKSDQTSEVVMQLSELMRYVIYRGKEEKVTLEEELKYIEDYISLQQIRLHQKLDLAIYKNISNKDLTLAPLLLIILVENAFKHGIEPAEGSAHLIIDIKADENTFFFQCSNTYEEETSKNGIGLENLKRRLEILYPEQHQLSLIKEDKQFIAQLKINFA